MFERIRKWRVRRTLSKMRRIAEWYDAQEKASEVVYVAGHWVELEWLPEWPDEGVFARVLDVDGLVSSSGDTREEAIAGVRELLGSPEFLEWVG